MKKKFFSGLQIIVCNGKMFFPISQPKHMLWVLKGTVSTRGSGHGDDGASL